MSTQLRKRGRPVGHKLSVESKQKISKSRTGQHHTRGTKDKISRGVTDYMSTKGGTTMAIKITNETARKYNFGVSGDIKIVEADPMFVYITEDLTYDTFLTYGMKLKKFRVSAVNKEETPLEGAVDTGFGIFKPIVKHAFSPILKVVNKPQDFDRVYDKMVSLMPNKTILLNTIYTERDGHIFIWERKKVPDENGVEVTKLILTTFNGQYPENLDDEIKCRIFELVDNFTISKFCHLGTTETKALHCEGYV